MQQLYQRLKEFYEVILLEGRALNWTPTETYDIALQSLIKILSLFFFKPWERDPFDSSFLTNGVNGCINFFHHVFIPNNTSKISPKPIFNLVNLSSDEQKLIQQIPIGVWDDLLEFIQEYNFSIKETFIQTSNTNRDLTPDFLSVITEMLLGDYEKNFMLNSKVTKRKKKGAYFSPWSIIRKLTDGVLGDEGVTINKTVLDPSCGTGSFLVYAAERIYSVNEKCVVPSPKMGIEIIQKYIFGVDNSFPSILVAKLRLQFWLMSKSPLVNKEITLSTFWNIQIGNSLFGLTNEIFQPTIDFMNTIPEIISKFEIDINSAYQESMNLKEWMSLLLQIKIFLFEEKVDPFKENRYDKFLQLIKPVFDNIYNQTLTNIVQKENKSSSLLSIGKIHPQYFHWVLFFPEIILKGGFDVCLGNPPYGRSVLTITEKNLLKISYESCQADNAKIVSLNAASAFLERSLKLLNHNGKMALILPYSLLRVEEFETIREYILNNYVINEIHDESSAFHEVTLEMCSMVITKKEKSAYTIRIYPRENYTSIDLVEKSVFQAHHRFMIYYDSFWEEVLNQGVTDKIMADYGVDHRIVKKDLVQTHSKLDGYTTPFLHSGKSVGKYALQPRNFHWAKPDQKNKRFNIYAKESKLVCTAIGNEFRVSYKPPGLVPGTNVSIMEITDPDYNLFPIMLILNSSLMKYILKRYILNYSHLTVYLHKYYTKLVPIKYPFIHSDDWKVLATYVSFLNQIVILDKKKTFEKEIGLLEKIIDYLVIQLYFPKTCENLNFCLEKFLAKFLVSIPFEESFQVMLDPNLTLEIITSKDIIIKSEKIVLDGIKNLKQNGITRILEEIENLLRKHPTIPLEIL